MQADVSEAALMEIRQILQNYQVQMTGIAEKAEREARSKTAWAEDKISEVRRALEAVRKTLRDQRAEAASMEEKKKEAEYEQMRAEQDAADARVRIYYINEEMTKCQFDIQSQNARNVQTPEQAAGVAEAIAYSEGRIRQLQGEIQMEQNTIAQAEARKQALGSEIYRLEGQLGECYEVIRQLEQRERALQEKEARLQRAFSRMQAEFMNYIGAARTFEYHSKSVAAREQNAVEQCLEQIEAYLTTRL